MRLTFHWLVYVTINGGTDRRTNTAGDDNILPTKSKIWLRGTRLLSTLVGHLGQGQTIVRFTYYFQAQFVI